MKSPLETFKEKLLKEKKEAELEAYQYFNDNIQKIDPDQDGHNDELDAFRHAYVSGIFAMKYGVYISKKLGDHHEEANPNPDSERAMDEWNNNVGRQYGSKTKNRNELAEMLIIALERGELIVDVADPRKYTNILDQNVDKEKHVVVFQEDETGRNQLFFDLLEGSLMDSATFVSLIQLGTYPGYEVASINGVATPKSKPDFTPVNNLG